MDIEINRREFTAELSEVALVGDMDFDNVMDKIQGKYDELYNECKKFKLIHCEVHVALAGSDPDIADIANMSHPHAVELMQKRIKELRKELKEWNDMTVEELAEMMAGM